MKSDTPETDALYPNFRAGSYDAMFEHARKLERQRNELLAALSEMAKQDLSDEMDDHTAEHADWETGYEELIKMARAAIAKAK